MSVLVIAGLSSEQAPGTPSQNGQRLGKLYISFAFSNNRLLHRSLDDRSARRSAPFLHGHSPALHTAMLEKTSGAAPPRRGVARCCGTIRYHAHPSSAEKPPDR